MENNEERQHDVQQHPVDKVLRERVAALEGWVALHEAEHVIRETPGTHRIEEEP